MGLGMLYLVSAISVWAALELALLGIRICVGRHIEKINEEGGESEEFLDKITPTVMGKRADFICLGVSLLSPLVILAGLILIFQFIRPALGGIETKPFNTGKA